MVIIVLQNSNYYTNFKQFKFKELKGIHQEMMLKVFLKKKSTNFLNFHELKNKKILIRELF
ncbi:hypothetical protein BST83_08285 [Polaribacter filamentus]|uniref:Uncharacterized protein n=1 Tax=Polaribacter filamentus TaxID=53483 RepID=A0A2S7KX29_9FLAO|nr:hypothetical protein BST83_08285 [Polaribacter filamentus]